MKKGPTEQEQEIQERLERGRWSPYERPRLSQGEKQLLAQKLQSQIRRQSMFKQFVSKKGFNPVNVVAGGLALVALVFISFGVWSAVMRPQWNTAASANTTAPTAAVAIGVGATSTPVSTASATPEQGDSISVTATPLSDFVRDGVKRSDLEAYFAAKGVEGAFVLYQQGTNEHLQLNPAMANERFIPASTFKILNALIGLQSGVIPDADYEMEWDGTMYGIEAWEQNHTLRTAMRDSAVWYYQELARQVGEEQMVAYVTAADYGNEDIAGGIDQFWLTGSLRISAEEQVDFLRRLYANQLPFSVENQEAVKELLLLEKTDSYALYGKTGWGDTAAGDVGWFVGYVETAAGVSFFATVIQSPQPIDSFGEARLEITHQILRALSVIDDF